MPSHLLTHPDGAPLAQVTDAGWVALGRSPADAAPPAVADHPVTAVELSGDDAVPGREALLSRAAVWLRRREDGRIRVLAQQSFGAVVLVRAPGVQLCALAPGEEWVLGEGRYDVEVVNGGPLARFRIVVEGVVDAPAATALGPALGPGGPGHVGPGPVGTTPLWSASDVLSGEVGWRTIAALCVLAVDGPYEINPVGARKRVQSWLGAAVGSPRKDKWTTDRLDAVIAHLGAVCAPGQDRVPVIAERMIRTGVLEEGVYEQLRERVAVWRGR